MNYREYRELKQTIQTRKQLPNVLYIVPVAEVPPPCSPSLFPLSVPPIDI